MTLNEAVVSELCLVARSECPFTPCERRSRDCYLRPQFQGLDVGGLAAVVGANLRRPADPIQSLQVLDRPASNVAAADLDAALGALYGIFSGREVQ